MPSKYAKILPKLPRLEEEPKYQARIDIAKEEFQGLIITLPELATTYAQLRGVKKEIESKLSGVNLRLEALKQLIVVIFEEQGTSAIRLVSGLTLSHQPEPHAVVKDREVFRLWCIDQKLEHLLMLLWQTTNSLTKEHLLKGEPEPDGVKAWLRDKLVLRSS